MNALIRRINLDEAALSKDLSLAGKGLFVRRAFPGAVLRVDLNRPTGEQAIELREGDRCPVEFEKLYGSWDAQPGAWVELAIGDGWESCQVDPLRVMRQIGEYQVTNNYVSSTATETTLMGPFVNNVLIAKFSWYGNLSANSNRIAIYDASNNLIFSNQLSLSNERGELPPFTLPAGWIITGKLNNASGMLGINATHTIGVPA